MSQFFIFLQITRLDCIKQVIHDHTHLVGRLIGHRTCFNNFFLHLLEFQSCIFFHTLNDFLHVHVLQFRNLAILLYCKIGQKLRLRHWECREHFKWTTSHAALVGGRILEYHHAHLLQFRAHCLGAEQVGTLHQLLEPWFAVFEQFGLVEGVDCLRPAPARH